MLQITFLKMTKVKSITFCQSQQNCSLICITKGVFIAALMLVCVVHKLLPPSSPSLFSAFYKSLTMSQCPVFVPISQLVHSSPPSLPSSLFFFTKVPPPVPQGFLWFSVDSEGGRHRGRREVMVEQHLCVKQVFIAVPLLHTL